MLPLEFIGRIADACGGRHYREWTVEVNPDDAFVKRIVDSSDDAFVADAASVLLDQALLSEGVMPKNPAEFARKLHSVLHTSHQTNVRMLME